MRALKGADHTEFTGNVALETSTGLELVTERLLAARDMSWLQTADPIQVRTGFGQLSANMARVERQMSQDGTSSYRFLFKGGVKLVYTHSE